MTSNVKSEFVWLPSLEEVVVKQEKNDSSETRTNTSGLSYQAQNKCKIEDTHVIYIKEEPYESIKDEDLSSLDSEYINHEKLRANNKTSESEDCEDTRLISKCPLCKTNYFRKKNDQEHTKSCTKRHNSPHNELFKESPSSSSAEEEEQTGEEFFVCPVCEETFITKLRLTRHLRIHAHVEELFSCDSQEKPSKEGVLTFHKTHIGEKSDSIDVCNKNITLTEHIGIHTGENHYSCNVCNKKFTRKGNLIVHRRTHTGDKPFSCDICNKKFIVKSNLTKHIGRHNGEKPFSCDMCNKEFSQKVHLNTHRKIHTGEKPFSCDVCNKKFTEKSNLTRHLITHTHERPFSCDLCNKTFTEKSNLTKHIKRHNGEKPFSCDVCNKEFTQKVHLNSHRKVHSNEKMCV